MITDPITLHRSQVKTAAAVLARAFYNDPPLVYSIPDISKRRAHSHHIFETYIRYSISCGEVYITSKNLEGVAVWLPSDKVEMNLRQGLQNGWLSVLLNLGLRTTLRQQTISNSMSAAHKRSISSHHWYLFLLGVEPALQGKGYASMLMQPMLSRADRDGFTCYLDNTNEDNLPIYRHFGFRVVEAYKIAESPVDVWAMVRDPC